MQLELKQVACYLPYGLKFSVNSQLYLEISLTGINGIFAYGNYHGKSLSFEFVKIKPILRPLSDLTEEQYAELDLNHNFSIVRFSDLEKDPTRYPYTIVQKLIEWHFDVFGLIDKGLAIDINILKQ